MSEEMRGALRKGFKFQGESADKNARTTLPLPKSPRKPHSC